MKKKKKNMAIDEKGTAEKLNENVLFFVLSVFMVSWIYG